MEDRLAIGEGIRAPLSHASRISYSDAVHEKLRRATGMSSRTRLAWAGLAAVGLVVLGVSVGQRSRSSHPSRTLEIEMRATAGTSAQLFWAADLRFVEERSVRIPLQPGSDGFQRLRFPLPPSGIGWLRFDPTDAPAEIVIGRVRLLDSNQHLLATFDPQTFKPANQIASMTRQEAGTKVTTTPGATDPFLFLSFGTLDRPSRWDTLWLVTPTALLVVSLLAVMLIATSVVIIGVAAFRTERSAIPPGIAGASRRLSALWMAVLFLLVFSAKLLLMRENPVTVPFWDQWDGEAAILFAPYERESLDWGRMFDFHNEHRILFTRLLALDLLAVNGEWDPRLEQVVNAGIHACTAVLVAVIFWVSGARRQLDLLVFVCALTFALPFSWDSTLIGFQSAFYFLLLFSVLALWLTTRHRVGTGPWYVGWVCALCGLFTAAGGLLIPLAIAGVISLKVLDDRQELRDAFINVGACACISALGVWLAAPPLADHAFLKVRTVADFVTSFGRDLAWPWIDFPPAAFVVWLPLAVLLAAAALRRARTTEFERLVVGLSIWVTLQSAALAYGRGVGGAMPATRYFDILSLGFVANTMALLAVLDRARASRAATRGAAAVLVGWLVVGAVGVDRLTSQSLTNLAVYRQYFAAHAANVRRYVITDDVAEFKAKQPLVALPYPSPEHLATLLQDPDIRRILPASVREPIHVQPQTVTNGAFVQEALDVAIPHDPLARGWLSLSDEGRRAQGRFESAPTGPCRAGGHLTFQVSGYLGWKGQYLAVKDLLTGVERAVRPSRVPEESWVEATIPCPAGPFDIVAIDATSESWFGFREPVERGRASPLVETFIGASRGLLIAALALAVLAARWS
jgi:hypothetical protein